MNTWTHAALGLILLGVSTLQASSASALPIEIRFTGIVTSVEEGSVLPSLPEVGSRFEGSLWFDPAEVMILEGNYVTSSEIPADFDLGGVALASGFYQFAFEDDYPGEDLREFECASICDIWEVAFTTYDENFFHRFVNMIDFLDQTATALDGDAFSIPSSVDAWSEARLRIIHPEPGGFRQDLEASIDAWQVVPEVELTTLLTLALVALGFARGPATPRRAPSRSDPTNNSARPSPCSACGAR